VLRHRLGCASKILFHQQRSRQPLRNLFISALKLSRAPTHGCNPPPPLPHPPSHHRHLRPPSHTNPHTRARPHTYNRRDNPDLPSLEPPPQPCHHTASDAPSSPFHHAPQHPFLHRLPGSTPNGGARSRTRPAQANHPQPAPSHTLRPTSLPGH